MSSWLNPLPSETVLGAIVGAVLSTALAYMNVFNVKNFTDFSSAVSFVFIVIVFAISLHFACVSFLKRSSLVALLSVPLLVFLMIVVALLDVEMRDGGHGDRFSLAVHPANLLLACVLFIWAAALLALTVIKEQLEPSDRG